MCKAMLINGKLYKTFWAEAIIATATNLQNRYATISAEKTAYELRNKHKPNFSHLKYSDTKLMLNRSDKNLMKKDNEIFVDNDLRSMRYWI